MGAFDEDTYLILWPTINLGYLILRITVNLVFLMLVVCDVYFENLVSVNFDFCEYDVFPMEISTVGRTSSISTLTFSIGILTSFGTSKFSLSMMENNDYFKIWCANLRPQFCDLRLLLSNLGPQF